MISTLTKKHHFDMVFDSQAVFRLVLEAASNPARVVNIARYADKLPGGYGALLALALTLLDNEVGFNAGENSALSQEIAALTLARQEPVETADFIFVTEGRELQSAITGAKCATLADPHKSATVVIQNNQTPNGRVTLSGPGIDGTADVSVAQTLRDAVALRDAQHYEYPQGIDFIFVSDGGDLIAIPRLTRMEVK